MLSNYQYFFFVNPYKKLEESGYYTYAEMRQFFTPHNFFLDLIMRFGFAIFVTLTIYLYFIQKNIKNLNTLYPFFFSSSFLSFDTLIFFPLFVLLNFIDVHNE